MSKSIKKEQVILTAPIKVKSSKFYPIIIEDANSIFHYFTENGKYDGYSSDCDPDIEHPELIGNPTIELGVSRTKEEQEIYDKQSKT